jgi:hypothetical protein
MGAEDVAELDSDGSLRVLVGEEVGEEDGETEGVGPLERLGKDEGIEPNGV